MKLTIPITFALLLAGCGADHNSAQAAVDITIMQEGPDVIARAFGTLDLPPSTINAHCGGVPGTIPDGAIAPDIGAICVGSGGGFAYSITGPSSFGAGPGRYADTSSGGLFGFNSALGILATSGTIIDSTSTWSGATLADLGISPGGLGTWQTPGGSVTARAEVPAPIGLLGVGAMLTWTRILRRKITEAR